MPFFFFFFFANTRFPVITSFHLVAQITRLKEQIKDAQRTITLNCCFLFAAYYSLHIVSLKKITDINFLSNLPSPFLLVFYFFVQLFILIVHWEIVVWLYFVSRFFSYSNFSRISYRRNDKKNINHRTRYLTSTKITNFIKFLQI